MTIDQIVEQTRWDMFVECLLSGPSHPMFHGYWLIATRDGVIYSGPVENGEWQ